MTEAVCVKTRSALIFLLGVALVFAAPSRAQVNYVARFSLEKPKYFLGEPIFCDFSIENRGNQAFTFSYRFPERVLNRELAQEPRFLVKEEGGRKLPDPAPRPCGGARGSVVYGYVSLPPGQKHTERWLLNQWARFSRPGHFRVHAERRLPLTALDPSSQKPSERPTAFAMATNDISFEVEPSTEAQLDAALQPFVKAADDPKASNRAEGFLVISTLSLPFSLPSLVAIANRPAPDLGIERSRALEGLARLGSRQAWQAILQIARGKETGNDALRSYAILLLGEKGDREFLPALLEFASTGSDPLRGDALRALGFFRDARANRLLFDKLHSERTSDRVNAILGLKNLESKNAVPALLAMLNDPDPEARQVAHFALQRLTSQKITLSATASRRESARVAEHWREWWRENEAHFVPVRQPPCHDW